MSSLSVIVALNWASVLFCCLRYRAMNCEITKPRLKNGWKFPESSAPSVTGALQSLASAGT